MRQQRQERVRQQRLEFVHSGERPKSAMRAEYAFKTYDTFQFIIYALRGNMSNFNRKVLLSDNICLKISLIRKRQSKRKPTNKIYLERTQKGEFHHLYKELRSPANNFLFYGYARMTRSTFDYILDAIRSEITLSSTNFQCPISVEERLILTIR